MAGVSCERGPDRPCVLWNHRMLHVVVVRTLAGLVKGWGWGGNSLSYVVRHQHSQNTRNGCMESPRSRVQVQLSDFLDVDARQTRPQSNGNGSGSPMSAVAD